MTVKSLIQSLQQYDLDSEVLFAEHDDNKGGTALYYLAHCCNTERQAEFGQVWVSRGSLAIDAMKANDKIFATEEAQRFFACP